ncbi:MAG: monovalent cation/H+ antiporter subunit D [Gammaproteobacteria bacterium]|nr:monovalent cation/H+ antiporter subunit D [Gammaproteobacteria bacterium]
MSHWIVAPVLVPLVTAALLILLRGLSPRAQALLSGLGLVALGGAVAVLAGEVARGEVLAYLLGDWRAPFGIALAADRLTILMLSLTVVVALACYIGGLGEVQARGPYWQALLHLQLMGLNGAFLTADLFNLFVFFEVLLMASYGLLLHGGRADRVRAATHYVVVNLVGSALFLVAAALLYGAVGTLNYADLALKVAAGEPATRTLVTAAGLLLLVVFGVKAALLPLQFWLPGTYAAAPAPVAALFAVMTKVGIYAVVRVHGLVFGPDAGALAHLAAPWLTTAGLLTLAVAAFGMLAADTLRRAGAFAVIASAGLLLAMAGLVPPEALGGSLYYLAQSTIATALVFLLAGIVARERGAAVGDDIRTGPRLPRAGLVGTLFLLVALGVAGLPPFAGFIGKSLILQSLIGRPGQVIAWSIILVTSLATLIALARATSRIFWESATEAVAADARAAGGPLLGAAGLLLAVLTALTVAATPVTDYMRAAAGQLADPGAYVHAVLSAQPKSSERAP